MAARSPDPADVSSVRRVAGALADFLHDEAAGGIALVVATIVALIWANVSLDGYEACGTASWAAPSVA